MQNRTLLPTALLIVAAAALGGCETTGTGPTQAAAPLPPTHQQAALDCWMGTEKFARTLSLDKRADLVDKCIADKMKGEPAPMLAAAKPAAQAKSAAEANPAAASSPAAPATVRAGAQPPKP